MFLALTLVAEARALGEHLGISKESEVFKPIVLSFESWKLHDQLQLASAICMKLHQNSYIFCRYRPPNYLLKGAGNDRPPRNVII